MDAAFLQPSSNALTHWAVLAMSMTWLYPYPPCGHIDGEISAGSRLLHTEQVIIRSEASSLQRCFQSSRN